MGGVESAENSESSPLGTTCPVDQTDVTRVRAGDDEDGDDDADNGK